MADFRAEGFFRIAPGKCGDAAGIGGDVRGRAEGRRSRFSARHRPRGARRSSVFGPPPAVGDAPQLCIRAPTAVTDPPQLCIRAPTLVRRPPQLCIRAPTVVRRPPQPCIRPPTAVTARRSPVFGPPRSRGVRCVLYSARWLAAPYGAPLPTRRRLACFPIKPCAPADGAIVAAGNTVAFDRSALDAEDGDIGGSIVWTVDGAIAVIEAHVGVLRLRSAGYVRRHGVGDRRRRNDADGHDHGRGGRAVTSTAPVVAIRVN